LINYQKSKIKNQKSKSVRLAYGDARYMLFYAFYALGFIFRNRVHLFCLLVWHLMPVGGAISVYASDKNWSHAGRKCLTARASIMRCEASARRLTGSGPGELSMP
jgi:hypothetical protein